MFLAPFVSMKRIVTLFFDFVKAKVTKITEFDKVENAARNKNRLLRSYRWLKALK